MLSTNQTEIFETSTFCQRNSFVKGSRNSQRDWDFTEKIGDSTIFGFGDGHGTWTPDVHAVYFNRSLVDLLSANAEYSPSDRLTLSYRAAVTATQQKFKFAEIGSSCIWFFVTPTETVWLARGDSEAACVLPDGTRWNTPVFDWNSDFGRRLAEEFACALGIKYTGNIPRTDAFAWENRMHPTFNNVQSMQVPETIGVMTDLEFSDLGRRKTKLQRENAVSLLCGSCDDTEFAACAEILFSGSPKGFKVLAASDGIRSKGSLGLDGAIDNVAKLVWDAPNVSAAEVIRLNTGYWAHSLGVSGSNQTQVLRTSPRPGESGEGFDEQDLQAPKCMMHSAESFNALLSAPDAMDRFQAAMLLWKNKGSLDRVWWDAIDEALAYLSKHPTRDSAPNSLEWVNQLAVVCMGDDNTSSSEWIFQSVELCVSVSSPPRLGIQLGQTQALQIAAIQEELVQDLSNITKDSP